MTSMAFHGGKMDGKVLPPPSKSHTHRAFFFAAMADGTSVISHPLISSDTKATLNACKLMGAETKFLHDGRISISGGKLHAPKITVDADNSGTTMRIFTGLCSMFDEPVTITGDESLLKRPMGPLLKTLEQSGIECVSTGGFPPITVKGPNKGGVMKINGSVSSQFITSLLMVSPMLEKPSEIIVEGSMVSGPYLDVTISMMRLFGASASRKNNVFDVECTGYKPYDYIVPSDFSSAAFPLVAGALGGKVTVTGMDLNDPQGDKVIVDILRKAGCYVIIDGSEITAEKGKLRGCEIDLGKAPDLFPIVAVMLSVAEGDSRLYGAPQLKFKESNRIETVVNLINSIGGSAEPTDDGCIIHGKPEGLVGGKIVHKGDHRLMMSAAVASLVCEGPVIMDDVECCAVSYPDFIDQMRELGMRSEAI